MGIHRGPNTVKDDLVFGYDTGYGVADNSTATRFYPGEATENLANTESLRTMANYGGGTTTYAEAPEKGPGWKKVTITAINGSNFRLSKFPYIGHPTNTTRIYSLELDFNGTSGYYVRGDGFTGLGPNVSTSGVHSWTLTTTTNSGVFALFLNNGRTAVTGLNDVIYYRYYQVEAKGHATPFTATTRSSTASLIDLKRTTDIDVSNVSFDSTGQPDFDGSDDEINIGTGLGIQNASFSVEAVIKWDGGSTDTFFGYKGATDASQQSIHWRIYSTGQLRFDFYSNSINSGGGAIVAGEWTHLTVTYDYDNDTCICYKNGILLMQGSAGPYTGADSTSTGYVGSWGPNNQHFGGQIPIFRVYNKTLTATEVKQNFNSQKNRFDI